MLAALIGDLLGFLRYNWRPASIYMGDARTMFIGLMPWAALDDREVHREDIPSRCSPPS
ncbi:MAG: hypothetical protein U0231_00645 [Nitrospiraceae bacterium]